MVPYKHTCVRRCILWRGSRLLQLGSCGVLSLLGHEAYALACCSTRLPPSVL